MKRIAVIERAVGIGMLVLVAGVYAAALSEGGLPPGHPWSGITLTLLAIRSLVWPLPAGSAGRSSALRAVVLALAMASAVAWAWSARIAAH